MRLAVLALCTLPWTGLAIGPATAQEALALDTFYGEWAATALDETPEAAALGLTSENFARTIEPTRRGFVVTWTVLRQDGGSVRTLEQEIAFEPAERPGVFGAAENGELLEGEPMTWARLAGDTLSLYQLLVNAAGGYELASYHHRLAGDEMTATVVFQREGAATARAGATLARAP